MFNKEEYMQELFEKYSRMSAQGFQDDNSNFFRQKIKVKRHFTMRKYLELVALLILCFGVSIFAYNESNKNNKEEINQKVNKINENLLTYDEMSITNSIRYKIIESYEEYVNFKATYNDIIEIEEKDFEKYFVFVAITWGNSYISNEYTEGETLYIDITRDYENEENRGITDAPVMDKLKVISTKISNKLKRDNVIITKVPLDSNGFVPIQQVIDRDNYTPEEAVKDGYVVTEYRSEDLKIYLLSDESILDDFTKKVENKEDANIRSVAFEMGLIKFLDVKYHDGVFSVYKYYKWVGDSNKSFGDFEIGDNIIDSTNSDGTERYYSIHDSNNGNACAGILCHYHF